MASRKPFVDGIYVVGPFANRVSFSSQQRRAISLVCDIHEDFKKAVSSEGITGRQVCIVGAGLAGITCAAVAAVLGANVYVLDVSPVCMTTSPETGLNQILATIRNAVHRDGHPSLNFWPHEDIEPITRLPLLNWYEGSCNEVAEQLAAEFRRLRSLDGIGNGIRGVVNGIRVKRLRPVASDSHGGRGRWRVVTDPPAVPTDRWNNDYDLVILATGFGIETAGYGTPSYWSASEDRVAAISEEPPPAFKNFVVSGTGDGGLIEVLRLLFKGKRAGNIEEEMMLVISSGSFRDRVARIENEAAKKLNDYVVHGGGSAPSKEVRDDLAEFLWTRYSDLVSREISDMLKGPLTRSRSRIESVTLLGQWVYPMELSASPFHRLMLMIAHSHGWISYIECAGKTRRRNVREVTLNNRGLAAPIADLVVTEAGKLGPPTMLKDAFFLARHGYETPLKHIWTETDVARIKHQQTLFADQDQLKSDYTRDISSRVGGSDPGDLEAYYRGSKGIIKKYFFERYGLRAHLVDEHDRRGILLSGGDRRNLHGKPAIPLSIFEKKVLNRNDPVASSHLDAAGGL